MTNLPMLQTKLNRPKCFQAYFERPHLHQKLDDGLHLPLTLISAGAGYGKSTLVSQWLNNITHKYTWLSCDEDINKLEVFISYLIHGISKSKGFGFEDTFSLLESSNEIPERTIKYSFISELIAINEKIILVLDDFHLINNPSIIELIDLLVKYPVDNLHLYILTRKEPNFITQQRLIKQSIQKIGSKDLSFSNQEIVDFAIKNLHKKIPPDFTSTLARTTEGWVMGLKHSIMYYDSHSSKKEFNLGKTSLVFNRYFLGEILSIQTDVMQSSLFICSLFNRFSSRLLYHVLNECHNYENLPDDIIQLFEKENYFLIALDDHKQWYRFHHQFQKSLTTYARQKITDELLNKYLHSGSKWLAANGFFEEAIPRAIETNSQQLSIELFEEFKYELLNKDQYSRLKHIYSSFPGEWTRKNPELIMTKVIILQYEGKINAIKRIIDNCNYFEKDKTIPKQTLAEYYTYKAMLYVYQGFYNKAVSFFDKGISFVSPKAESLCTYSAFFKSQALSAIGTITDGLHFLNSSLDALLRDQHHSKARLLIAKVMLYKNWNDFKNMEAHLPSIIKISERNLYYEVLGLAYHSQIEILYRQNRFEEFSDYFERSYKLRYLIRSSWFIYIWLFKLLFHLKTNDHFQLNKTVNELDKYALELEGEELKLLLKYFHLEIAIQNNDLNKVHKLVSKNNYEEIPPIRLSRYYFPQITYLKMLLLTGTPQGNKTYKSSHRELLSFAEKGNNIDLLIQLKLINCLLNYRQGNLENARKDLKEAIKLTGGNQDLLVFTEFGNDLHELILSLPATERKNLHVQEILKVYNTLTTSQNDNPQSLQESIILNNRDIRILRMVSKGYKNEEIAEAMFLSTESIKKYLYNAYQILGVNNRIKAAIKAKELGLLENVD